MAYSTYTAIFAGVYENLAKIAGCVQLYASEAGFDAATRYQIETAIDEACSNIIEHGYGGEGRGDIECSFEITEQKLTVTLKDHGQPFDLSCCTEPDLKAPLNKRDNHGLGVYFIRKLMDEIHSQHDPIEGNVLTLVKNKGKTS